MGLLSVISKRASTLPTVKTFLNRFHDLSGSLIKRSLSKSFAHQNKNDSKKILFFGTDSFSLETLKALHQN
jgi:hypothetical protein